MIKRVVRSRVALRKLRNSTVIILATLHTEQESAPRFRIVKPRCLVPHALHQIIAPAEREEVMGSCSRNTPPFVPSKTYVHSCHLS